ncbi:RICIN domain-containing protein [Sinomonas sp. JGH33]|uniref:RICIN domain-containing protein n=1 Tax=Sinomonas terricola TaxID=3110330 RepID=A0ABU5TB77_9MICC|nr:RICIN domain-containing protein [Sinomonas sp. JGH33]
MNANQPFRAVTHGMAGSLYGLSANGTPAQRYVAPLHQTTFVQMAPGGKQLPNGEPAPAGDALVVAPEAQAVGAKVIVRMPDWYPNFPYKWVSWSDWLSAVDTQIASVKSSGATNIGGYALWNEPDWTWDSTNAGPFNDGWVRTYNEVRAHDTATPILGPSTSIYGASFMQSFLSNAKANNAVPDVISWHELQGDANIAADVSAYRSLEASLGISPRPIEIEEYGTTSEVGVPGALVGYVAKFERAGVDNAELAFWNQYGTLGDTLVSTGGLPNASWWLYKWYGDMTGQMVQTTPPAQTGIDGAASVNSANNAVSVVFGGGSGSSAVTVNGLGALAAFGTSAHVVLEQVASAGRTTPTSAPYTISVGDFPITNGSITVPVNAMNPTNGYHLVVTPAGTASTSLNGTYKLQNVNSALDLGIANTSTASGTQALQWSDNGTRDHLWDLVADGNGAYKIINENSGLVLGTAGNSTSQGAAAQQVTDTGDLTQHWTAVAATGGSYKLVNQGSGLVLGITNSSTAAGATALQWGDNGTQDHLWNLVAAPRVTTTQTYTISNVNSGLNLATAANGTAAGTLVDQDAPGGASQTWQFIDAGNGEYKIKNVASGLLLGIQNASTSQGASALIWSDNGTSDHLWQVEPGGDGSFLIANANSGLVLGITNKSTSAGAQALQWGDNGTPDHRWRLNPQN